MKKYYIYHVPTVKIGCSVNPKARVNRQGYTEFEILEEHIDITTAEQREIELQKQYGYKIDKCKYSGTVSITSEGGKIGGKIAGKIAGRIAVESGHLARISSLGGRVAGRKNVESGQLDNARLKAHELNSKPVIAINIKTGERIEFKSGAEAARKLKLHQPHITSVLKGRLKTTGGYKFECKNK